MGDIFRDLGEENQAIGRYQGALHFGKPFYGEAYPRIVNVESKLNAIRYQGSSRERLDVESFHKKIIAEEDIYAMVWTIPEEREREVIHGAVKMLLENNPVQTRLYFHDEPISDAGVQVLASALKDNRILEELDFVCLSLGTPTVSFVGSLFFPKANRIGDKGAEALAEVLETNQTLQRLDLSNEALWGFHTQIGNAGARALAKGLEKNQSLRELGLMSHQIGDEGVQALARALETNRTLQKLNLRNNRVKYEGAKALAEALLCNHGLRELNLSAGMANSNQIGPMGGAELGKALQVNETLQVLNLQGNSNIDIAPLASALETNRSLQKINLTGTRINDEGAMLLAEGLYKNQTLRELILTHNPISKVGRAALSRVPQSKQGHLRLSFEPALFPRETRSKPRREDCVVN